jgi:hypothetical protein
VTRPTLGLAIATSVDALLARFLGVMARWTSVRQAYPSDAVDWWLVTDGVSQEAIGGDTPVMVWTDDPGPDVASRWPDAIIVGPRGGHGRRGVVVPDPSVDATMIPYVPPLVRQRWRRRYGLPGELVLRVDDDAADVSALLRPTALAVASVVIATGDAVVSSLAWGAPTVTDEKTAERLRLGNAVEAVNDGRFAEAAARLVGSQARMAELAWRGRSAVEERFDLAGAAYSALQMADMHPPEGGARAVVSQLNALWASSDSAWSIIRAISG